MRPPRRRRFTSGYYSASSCTPTHSSFLTGTYAFRQRITGIALPNSPAIIQPGTETIASRLQRAGYITAVIGKRHLGLGGKDGPDWNGELRPGPLEIGFDRDEQKGLTADRPGLASQLVNRLTELIDAGRSRPTHVGPRDPAQ